MKIKKLLFAFLIILLYSCSIFDKDSDNNAINSTNTIDTTKTIDTTNTNNITPFEGTWKFILGEFVFKGNLVSLNSYGDSTQGFSNKTFSYNETTKKVKIDTITHYYLIKNNQLMLGNMNETFNISGFQKSNTNSSSNFKMVSNSNSFVASSYAHLSSYYKDKDLVLDSLQNIDISSLEFVSYKDTNRSVSIVIKDPSAFTSLALNTEVSIPLLNGLYISLDGYDANYKKIGSELNWTISKFKLKNYSYDSTSVLKAVFYDLKNSAGTTLLDTLELNIDFSNEYAFKTMLKNLP